MKMEVAAVSETATEYEQLILSVQECFVYKVPPLRAASGHRFDLPLSLFSL
jgi:hypothetical protein